jgi:chloride channel protein, CIC family
MEREPELLFDPAQGRRNPLLLAILSLIVGAVAGLLGAAFRIALQRANDFRNSLALWAHEFGFAGFLTLLGETALAAGVAAWMVRVFRPNRPAAAFPTLNLNYSKNGQGVLPALLS